MELIRDLLGVAELQAPRDLLGVAELQDLPVVKEMLDLPVVKVIQALLAREATTETLQQEKQLLWQLFLVNKDQQWQTQT